MDPKANKSMSIQKSVVSVWAHHHNENHMLTLYLKFQWNIKSSQNVINKVALKYDILKYNSVLLLKMSGINTFCLDVHGHGID